MKLKLKFRKPYIADSITIESKEGKKPPIGFKNLTTVHVSSLSNKEAKKYANLLRKEFLKNWKKRRV